MPWHALSARTRALTWSSFSDDDTDGVASQEGQGADQGTERLDADAIRAAVDEALREAERLETEAPFTGEPLGEGEAASGVDGEAERVLEYLAVLYSCTFAAYQEALRRLPEASGSAMERFEEFARTLHSEAERPR